MTWRSRSMSPCISPVVAARSRGDRDVLRLSGRARALERARRDGCELHRARIDREFPDPHASEIKQFVDDAELRSGRPARRAP